MVRTAILLVFILLSCSPGRSGVDGGEATDALDVEAEKVPDGLDARDLSEDREEADLVEALDAPDVRDATEEPPGECSTPIRDCGPGCRQVTCLAYIVHSDTWDVSSGTVAYYSYHRYNRHGVGLYVKDLSTGDERKTLSYPSDDYPCWYLAIYQNKISYELLEGSEPNYTRSLHLFDLATSDDVTLLSSSGTSHDDLMMFKDIDVYGDIIVWNGKDVGDILDLTDLFVFDLAVMQRTRVTDGITCDSTRIWGRNVSCEGWWGDNLDEVAFYDLDAGGGLQYIHQPSSQINPDIWENRVAWVDFRAEECADIYWCELPDCEPQPVTTNWACQDHPAIGGDWVVWQDWRNDADPLAFYEGNHDNIEIWGYNFTTGQEYQIASFGEVIGERIKIEGEKVYFDANPVAGAWPADTSTVIFEVDLSQFL